MEKAFPISNRMKKILIYFAVLGALIPQVTYAQVCNLSSVTSLINCITGIITGSIIQLLVALAVVFFLWGAAKFLRNAEDSGKREEGRMFMLYGIIALFVIVSVWGLVGVLANTFGISIGQPQFPGGGGFGGGGSSGGSINLSPDCVRLYGPTRCAELNSFPGL